MCDLVSVPSLLHSNHVSAESSNFFFPSGCGFYDRNGTACCRSNGNDNQPQCIPNQPVRINDDCRPRNFGGIPSFDGVAGSDICNGNEVLDGNSCLVAPVNSDCTCFPSATQLCKTPSNSDPTLVAKTVCRAKDMTDAVLDTDSCGQCRKCMQDECATEALNKGEQNDWSTEDDVQDTLDAWDNFTCRTAVATNCAAFCAF